MAINKEHYFFSVLIPIYNVSKFIDTGINYVLNQTFDDYEIILIEDGSTDDSGKMCDRLSSETSRIKCFHEENKGSGPARNLGIEKASGKYIVFYDIDDSIEQNLLQICYDELNKNNLPDVFMFSYDSFDQKYKTTTPVEFDSIVCNNNDEIKNIFIEHLLGIKKTNGFVWNKVYKKDFIQKNNLQFPDLIIQQDEVFNLSVYSKADSLVISPIILYHYIVYDKGNTRSRYIPNRLSIYNKVKESFLDLYKNWELNDSRMLVFVYRRFFNAIIETLNFNNTHKSSHMSAGERKQDLKMIIECEETHDCIKKLADLDAIPTEYFFKLYYKAIKDNNISFYQFIRFIDKSFKSLKWSIKKHLR